MERNEKDPANDNLTHEEVMARLRADLHAQFATRPVCTNPATLEFLETLKGEAR